MYPLLAFTRYCFQTYDVVLDPFVTVNGSATEVMSTTFSHKSLIYDALI